MLDHVSSLRRPPDVPHCSTLGSSKHLSGDRGTCAPSDVSGVGRERDELALCLLRNDLFQAHRGYLHNIKFDLYSLSVY